VADLNQQLLADTVKGRIYSYGRYLDVYKGVGYPSQVAEAAGLKGRGLKADLWLAHTRQPTNSPGTLPIWSHPFTAFEWAIVHNGDISSFGANREFLASRGHRSFVGTDSEVIALLLDQLTRVEGLEVVEAARLVCRPYERELQHLDGRLRPLLVALRGACLDGPFTVLAGYCDGDDLYLLALLDRSKFRPIIIGEADEYIYAASEEAAIRAIAPHAKIYAPAPNRFFLASSKQGVIEAGRGHLDCYQAPALEPPRPSGLMIDATTLDYHELNRRLQEAFNQGVQEISLVNVRGQRYIGLNAPRGAKITVYGAPGNCLANLNEGAEIVVYGNAADDVGDTMQDGRVIIHGDARDVVGQTLQGGVIYVRGVSGTEAPFRCGSIGIGGPFWWWGTGLTTILANTWQAA
jgi:hypothetical protein